MDGCSIASSRARPTRCNSRASVCRPRPDIFWIGVDLARLGKAPQIIRRGMEPVSFAYRKRVEPIACHLDVDWCAVCPEQNEAHYGASEPNIIDRGWNAAVRATGRR